MSPDKTQEMTEGISKRVRHAMLLATTLVLFVIWFDECLGLLSWLRTQEWNLKFMEQLPPKIIGTVVTVLTCVVTFILHVGRDLDLHNSFDRIIGTRRATDEIIRRELEIAAAAIDPRYVAKMKADGPGVMRLFYHFANGQDVLRGLAFTYWEQYFVNLYKVFIFLLCFLASLGVVLFRGKVDPIVAFPAFFFILILVYAGGTHAGLRKKILALPVQQVAEIRASSSDELKSQLQARFGGIIV